MSELLAHVANHIRALPDEPAHVCVILIDAHGNAESFFYGENEGAALALNMLPEVAQELVDNLSCEAGMTSQPALGEVLNTLPIALH